VLDDLDVRVQALMPRYFSIIESTLYDLLRYTVHGFTIANPNTFESAIRAQMPMGAFSRETYQVGRHMFPKAFATLTTSLRTWKGTSRLPTLAKEWKRISNRTKLLSTLEMKEEATDSLAKFWIKDYRVTRVFDILITVLLMISRPGSLTAAHLRSL